LLRGTSTSTRQYGAHALANDSNNDIPSETELLALLSLRSVCLSACVEAPMHKQLSRMRRRLETYFYFYAYLSHVEVVIILLFASLSCMRAAEKKTTIISIAAFIAGASTISRQHARKTLDSFAPIGGANAADKSSAAAAAADDEPRVPRAAGNALCSLPDPTLDETLTLGALSVITRRGLCLLSQLRI
jgi:hypothetical protein